MLLEVQSIWIHFLYSTLSYTQLYILRGKQLNIFPQYNFLMDLRKLFCIISQFLKTVTKCKKTRDCPADKLCFILDLMNGGDLHYHLSQVYISLCISVSIIYLSSIYLNLSLFLSLSLLKLGLQCIFFLRNFKLFFQKISDGCKFSIFDNLYEDLASFQIILPCFILYQYFLKRELLI